MTIETDKRKVLLVGWDGADWKVAEPLMKAGLMPTLSHLVAKGASGTIASYAPYMSPMLWTTIATGKYPDKHGVHGFAEVRNGFVAPVSSHTRQVKAFWNILSESGISSGSVGWFASHPAEKVLGFSVSDAFIHPGNSDKVWSVVEESVYPADAAADLAETRVRPEDLDLQLLGLFIPDIAKIDLREDPRPLRLIERLAELYTTHNTMMQLVGKVSCLSVYYHFLDWVSHDFMPLCAPKRNDISNRDFELYGQVVNGAYRLQDLLLADLLKEADSDVNVILVSDHGFLSGNERPEHTPKDAVGMAAWHRPLGVLVMQGPAIMSGAKFNHARLEDVTPTLLALYGLATGEDMDGRVLFEALLEDSPPKVSTWENPTSAAPNKSPLPGGTALLQRFVSLGYLDPISDEGRLTRQNVWNLGVALLELGRAEDALEHLEQCYLEEPESQQHAYHTVRCRLALGLFPEARAALATLEDLGAEEPTVLLLRARIFLAEDFPQDAWKLLMDGGIFQGKHAEERDGLRRRILIKQGSYEDAENEILSALARRPARGWDLVFLGYAQLCLGKFDEAIQTVSGLLATEGRMLGGFSVLAQALEQVQRLDEARKVYLTWLQIEPAAEFALARLSALSKSPPQRLSAQIAPEIFDKKSLAFAENRNRLRQASADRLNAVTLKKQHERAKVSPVFPYIMAPVRKINGRFLIVSGAPRSGTSLMMRMLAMAGMQVFTDGVRTADEDNPTGYFEWEGAKKLPAEQGLIELAEGKVVKIFSGLLPYLPSNRRYQVIFMRRPVVESIRSQDVMLNRSVTVAEKAGKDVTIALEEHITEVLSWAKNSPNIELLEVPFRGLFDDPSDWCEQILQFIGPGRIKNVGAMSRAIRPELYRQREGH